MTLPKFARCWLLKRELERNLAERRAVRRARSEAAQRGYSTEIRNRARKCREVLGGA